MDDGTAPPKENRLPMTQPTAPARNTSRPSIKKATIDKPIQPIASTPRVHEETRPVPTNTLQQKTLPAPRVMRKSRQIPPTIEKSKILEKIRDKTESRTRLPHQTHMQFRQQEQRKRVQLIRDNDTGEYLNYRQLMQSQKHGIIWNRSSAYEFGQLAQGLPNGRVAGTNTIFFIRRDKVPKDRQKDVTYLSFSCDMKSNKKETHRTRITAGGDRINYPEDVGTPAADMTLVKTFFNSVISTKGARCVMLDVKDFYLNTPMKRYEYMRIKITDIPEEVIQHYRLLEIVTEDRYNYCEIRKGMYGLPQAGIIAQELLQERLAKVGYHQSKIVPGLWTHKTRNTCFTLVVDDFAIKYTKKEDAQHLIDALEKDYTISTDWDAAKYIGLTIDWDYTKSTHARIFSKSTAAFQTPHADETTKLTSPPRCSQLRCQSPIQHSR